MLDLYAVLRFIDVWKFSSSWQPIKIAWTKSIIALGKLGEDTLIDAVPIDEVSEIHNMQEGSSIISVSHCTASQVEKGSSIADMSNLENHQSNSKPSLLHQPSMWIPCLSRNGLDSSKNLTALQSKQAPVVMPKLAAGCVTVIMTDDKGYNSGRKYYFQAKCDADRREIVDILAAKTKTARLSKEAKGKIQRIRERVSVLTKSDMFQYFFAFLIAMVRL